MTGMSLKDGIELSEVPLAENYPPEDMLPENELYCYLLQPAQNTMTSAREPRIKYGVRELTDWVKSYRVLVME